MRKVLLLIALALCAALPLSAYDTGDLTSGGTIETTFSSDTTIDNAFPRFVARNLNTDQGAGGTYNVAEIELNAGADSVIGGLLTSFGTDSPWEPSLQLRTKTDHPLLFRINNNEFARMTTTRRLGINQAAPVATLEVVATSATTTDTAAQFSNNSGAPLATLLNNGKLGIRTPFMDSYYSGGSDIVIASSAGDNGGITILTDASHIGGIFFARGMGADATKGQVYYQHSTDELYCLAVSGGVKLTSGATSWASASDRALKKDIEDIPDGALVKVALLKPSYFKLKTDPAAQTRRVGLIAQDVQAAVPEAVSVGGDGMLCYRPTELIPVLVKAIQEQQAQIDALKARLDKLEAKP